MLHPIFTPIQEDYSAFNDADASRVDSLFKRPDRNFSWYLHETLSAGYVFVVRVLADADADACQRVLSVSLRKICLEVQIAAARYFPQISHYS